MPGPMPSENPRRRNKPRSTPLSVPPGAFSGVTPELPNAENYSARTRAWYEAYRTCEQAPTFTKTAWQGLWDLADLMDYYYANPRPATWAQIKQTLAGYLAFPADQRKSHFKVELPKPTVVPSPAGVAVLADRRARLIANAK